MDDAPQTRWLSFRDAALEQEFRTASAMAEVRRHRLTWATLTVVAALLGFSDPIVSGGSAGNLKTLLIFRLTLIVPTLAAVTALGWARREVFVRFRDAAVTAGLAAVFWLPFVMWWILPDRARFQSSQGAASILVEIVSAYTFLSPRLTIALPTILPYSIVVMFVWSRLPYLPDKAMTIAWVAACNVTSILGLIEIEQSRRRAFLATRSLEREHERAEGLLNNMLPRSIASRLKVSTTRIAEHFDDASVLFGDIVGFTPLSQALSPAELVDALDDVFSAFDDAAQRLGLEKIKTIGDAYMVVGGVPGRRPDHLDALAEMALEMQKIVDSKRFAGGRRLQMRIGIHAGPVVAGVIGKKKFVYDLWGDTVNTASRMESHGIEGAIHVSEGVAERLRPRFEVSARGTIHVKGKGEMNTWLVVAKRDGGANVSMATGQGVTE